MKFICIIGNAAVGKMTVGQEIVKITDLRLFHNHIVIEPVLEIFGYKDNKIVDRLRTVILEEFAASTHYGLIMTSMINFNSPPFWDFINQMKELFGIHTEFYYVELVASQEIRLQRNVSENRLLHKASKRDIEASNQRLLNDDKNLLHINYDGEITFDNYIKIDNSNISPDIVAKMIKETFSL